MKDYKKVIENINYCISALRQSKKPEDLKTMKIYIDFNFRHDFNELSELLYIYKFRETSDDHDEEIEKLVNTLSEIENLLKIIISTSEIDPEVITIKEKLIDLCKKSELFNIKNIDEDAYNIWEYEIKKFLDEFNFKIDFKSDFERLKRKEYKGIVASKEEISVPHLENRIYQQRALILRIIKNLIKQGKDFIVSSTIDYYKPIESYQDTAEVCLNGHVINANIKKNPALRKKHCGICGEKTITQCPVCGNPIPGRIIYANFEDKTVWVPPSNYCVSCGKPYPWFKKMAEEISSTDGTEECDAFLSHADEDKQSIADELFERLKNDKFKIWYDRSIKTGQSIPEKINEGIKQSKNGIVIFSKYYEKSRWCKEEFAALTYKSKSCQNFEIIIILHNYDFDTFKKNYPLHAHRLIIPSKLGMNKIIAEVESQLNIKTIIDKKAEVEVTDKYIKMSTDAVIECYNYNPEKNHSLNNHSKKIILANLKDIPLTITKIVIKTDFPVIQKFFNSDAKIELIKKEYKFNSSGEIEIQLNQNPLILSPKANVSLILSLYTSTKVSYKGKYNFKYSIDINEYPKKSEGNFKIKTTVIKN